MKKGIIFDHSLTKPDQLVLQNLAKDVTKYQRDKSLDTPSQKEDGQLSSTNLMFCVHG